MKVNVQIIFKIIVVKLTVVNLVAANELNVNYTSSRYGQVLNLYRHLVLNNDSANGHGGSFKYNFSAHPCKRNCQSTEPMTCYYYMVIHYDETMGKQCQHYLNTDNLYKHGSRYYVDIHRARNLYSDDSYCKYADGVKSEVMVVNGQFPGEPIEVCYGDTIIADVLNTMHETTTIHWHGMHHFETPYMDGVPHITQYPIEPGQAFRYRFLVDHAGTHWWHSHSDHQRAFGLAGALIVKQTPAENPHSKLYDYDNTEHVIMLQDWQRDFDESSVKAIIINGLGQNVKENKENPNPTAYERFEVKRGARYRFRVIFNGVANCPVALSIDHHDLLVIASDGNDVEPIKVQRIMFHGGERYDFILHANRSVRNYWMHVKGYTFCAVDKLYQAAILHYKGSDPLTIPRGLLPNYNSMSNKLLELNGLEISQKSQQTNKHFSLMDVNALSIGSELPEKADHTFYIDMNVIQRGASPLFQIDGITFSMPHVSLLQARKLGVDKWFCNKTQQSNLGFDCEKRHCRCTNVIHVPAFKHIELVIVGKSNTAHPVHLHGYTFRVVGMGSLGDQLIHKLESIDLKQPLPRRVQRAPLKDTVQVPAYGYTIIRFFSDNPGYWIIHCHISTHAENGMSAVLKVGEDNQMKQCPVSNCGLCSSVA